MQTNDDSRTLQAAMSLHQQGRLQEAAGLYRSLLKRHPNHAHTLHLLGLVAADSGQFTEARAHLTRALELDPLNLAVRQNFASILFRMRDYRSALDVCEHALKRNAVDPTLLYVSAVSLLKLNAHEEALTRFDVLLQHQPANIAAVNEKGAVLARLRRFDEAAACFDQALRLDANYAQAHLNRAALAAEQGRYDQALSAYDRLLQLQPKMALAQLGQAEVLRRQKRYDEALAVLDRIAGLEPNLAEAWSARGTTLWELARHDEALTAYDRALALDPQLAVAWAGRGNVLTALRRQDEALTAYGKATELDPSLARSWAARGDIHLERRDFAEAIRHYERAFALDPELPNLEGLRLHCRMHLCDWAEFDSQSRRLAQSINAGRAAAPPFAFLALPSSAAEQLQCARAWTSIHFPASPHPVWQGQLYRHERLRLAYLSGDFRDHAIAYLVAGVFEAHDRSRFELVGLSSGPDDGSAIRKRIEPSFDRFIDVRGKSDDDLAALLRSLEIDVLIDVSGLTQHARTGVVARRPAPIQVNYLGYPGTTGAPSYDYIVADPTVIPAGQKMHYTEKVVHLPDCYQANDSKRTQSSRAFSRAEMRLPAEGVVFCCFNNGFKILPDVFACWMRILSRVEGSALWLFEENPIAPQNLRREAARHGVDPARLVFATRLPHDDHMARLSLADIFLDTAPYNAHTTGSDALWAGVPLITCIGDTFASRVAASLLSAIGAPELVAQTRAAYEALAIALANEPQALSALKKKIAGNRQTAALFDTARYTRHLEAAYISMQQRHEAGLPPDDIILDGSASRAL